MKNAALLSLACLLGMALDVHQASAFSGKELYESCSDKNNAGAETSSCSAYIHGVIDGMIMGYTAHGTSHGYCPPTKGVSVTQGRSIIEKFLRNHPERLKTEAGILAGLAMTEAFPCRKVN